MLKFFSSFVFWLTMLSALGLKAQPVATNGSRSRLDSINLLVVIDVVEQDFPDSKYYLTKFSGFENEKALIITLLKKGLGDKIKLKLPSDSTCYKKYLKDSSQVKDNLILSNICLECDLKSVLVYYVTWTYLSNIGYETMGDMHRNTVSGPNTILTGTWWNIKVSIFDSNQSILRYYGEGRFHQWGQARPMKNFPGITHKRFFKRSIRRIEHYLDSEIQS